MKPNELEQLINETLLTEARKAIISESMDENHHYQIKCEGEPVETFESEEEAMQHLDIYKKEHPKKEFIIEKIKYESKSDMIDQLSEMGEKLEESKQTTMKKTTIKVRGIAEAVYHAKKNGLTEFNLAGTKYNVDECWKKLEEGWTGDVEEDAKPDFLDLDKDGDTKEPMKVAAKQSENNEGEDCMECGDMNEGTCETCGKEICECGNMNESKKTTLRLTESELVKMIQKMVNESVPGLNITKNAQTASEKETKEHLKNVESKLKDYLSFEGNDNPEFPSQIKGDVKGRQNTSEEDEFVEDNRGGGMEDLDYDNEPSKEFKERLDKALKGDTTMGNSQDAANVVKSDLGDKISKKVARKKEAEEKAPMYNKDSQPVNESVTKELSLMKSLFEYNKKTQ